MVNNFCSRFFNRTDDDDDDKMSTERELTPGGPTQLQPIPYADLATTIQLNGGVNYIAKSYGMCFTYELRLNRYTT